jgi:hypothetical protein
MSCTFHTHLEALELNPPLGADVLTHPLFIEQRRQNLVLSLYMVCAQPIHLFSRFATLQLGGTEMGASQRWGASIRSLASLILTHQAFF